MESANKPYFTIIAIGLMLLLPALAPLIVPIAFAYPI